MTSPVLQPLKALRWGPLNVPAAGQPPAGGGGVLRLAGDLGGADVSEVEVPSTSYNTLLHKLCHLTRLA